MKTTPLFTRHLVAIAVATAALPAAALADSAATLTLPAIDVVGYGDDDRSRQTGAVVVITREEIERLQYEIAERYGFELIDHSLVLYVKSKDSD